MATAKYQSPEVRVTEKDLSFNVPAISISGGATVIESTWGPIEDFTAISGITKLENWFGKPTDRNYLTWFPARNFLSYSQNLTIVRVADQTARNAVVNLVDTNLDGTPNSILIKNDIQYEDLDVETQQVSGVADITEHVFCAKYAGNLGNSLAISIADAGNYEDWAYKYEFDDAPSTSKYLKSLLPKGTEGNDELHVVIIDKKGLFTGTPNSILEKYAFLSKARDAKQEDNAPSYYVNVINEQSQYVRFMGHIDTLDDSTLTTPTLQSGFKGQVKVINSDAEWLVANPEPIKLVDWIVANPEPMNEADWLVANPEPVDNSGTEPQDVVSWTIANPAPESVPSYESREPTNSTDWESQNPEPITEADWIVSNPEPTAVDPLNPTPTETQAIADWNASKTNIASIHSDWITDKQVIVDAHDAWSNERTTIESNYTTWESDKQVIVDAHDAWDVVVAQYNTDKTVWDSAKLDNSLLIITWESDKQVIVDAHDAWDNALNNISFTSWGSFMQDKVTGELSIYSTFEPFTFPTGTQETDKKHFGWYGSFKGGDDGDKALVDDFVRGWSMFRNTAEISVGLLFIGNGGSDEGMPTIARYGIDNICVPNTDSVLFFSPKKKDLFNKTEAEAVERAVVTNREVGSVSSYGFMDSNWKLQYDQYNDKMRWVPLNGDIAGLCARTDYKFDPWYSPAGETRGVIKDAMKLMQNFSKFSRDELYRNSINPVVKFIDGDTILYGDRTLQRRDSAFRSINVRRLFIVLEKAISKASGSLLFEINDEFTRSLFVNMVEPYLRDVKGRRGIYDYHVECSEVNNTPEVIDRQEFVGDIYIKPARSINFVSLNFVATRTGVSFEELVRDPNKD